MCRFRQFHYEQDVAKSAAPPNLRFQSQARPSSVIVGVTSHFTNNHIFLVTALPAASDQLRNLPAVLPAVRVQYTAKQRISCHLPHSKVLKLHFHADSNPT